MLANEKDVIKRVADAKSRLHNIAVPYPRQAELQAALDELRQTTALTRGSPQQGVYLFGPSYSGKTFSAKQYIEHHLSLRTDGDTSVPAALVTVDPEASMAALASDILRGIGCRRPDAGSTDIRWERVRNELRARQVDLLIFDEFQRAGRRVGNRTAIAGKIQDLMEQGYCSVALLGLQDAEDILSAAPDLPNRFDVPVDMPPLDWSDADDRAIFERFVADYDHAIITEEILPERSAWVDDHSVLERLMESSSGLIGQCVRLIQVAVTRCVREGHPCISSRDLADAVTDWAVRQKRISYNPFETTGAA